VGKMGRETPQRGLPRFGGIGLQASGFGKRNNLRTTLRGMGRQERNNERNETDEFKALRG